MASLESERKLRLVTVITFIPAFPMLLGGAVASSGVVIGMGILPLFCSSASGLVHLSRSRKGKSRPKTAFSNIIDIVIGCIFLGILLPFWIIEPVRLNQHANFMLLEAYSSIFLILNAGIHFFIPFSQIYAAIWSSFTGLFACRECRDCARNTGRSTTQRTRDGAQYSFLNPDEEGFRDSVDEETAEIPKEPKGRPSSARGEEEAMLAQV